MTPLVFYLIIAVALIGAELLIMNFSAFWFFFFGLGAALTALVCWVLPDVGFVSATAIFLCSSVVIALLLYPILKKWQVRPSALAGNDAIGQTVKVVQTVSSKKEGKVFWSGTHWSAYLEADSGNSSDMIEQEEEGIIQRIEGIHLYITRK